MKLKNIIIVLFLLIIAISCVHKQQKQIRCPCPYTKDLNKSVMKLRGLLKGIDYNISESEVLKLIGRDYWHKPYYVIIKGGENAIDLKGFEGVHCKEIIIISGGKDGKIDDDTYADARSGSIDLFSDDIQFALVICDNGSKNELYARFSEEYYTNSYEECQKSCPSHE